LYWVGANPVAALLSKAFRRQPPVRNVEVVSSAYEERVMKSAIPILKKQLFIVRPLVDEKGFARNLHAFGR
jgi:hypothetical protein